MPGGSPRPHRRVPTIVLPSARPFPAGDVAVKSALLTGRRQGTRGQVEGQGVYGLGGTMLSFDCGQGRRLVVVAGAVMLAAVVAACAVQDWQRRAWWSRGWCGYLQTEGPDAADRDGARRIPSAIH